MAADTSMWSSEAWSSAADIYLLARSREGSAEAFGELWRRHLPAAYAVATKYRSRTAAEDVVAEASARVFALIQQGKGPDEHFRAYFLSAVKTVAIDQGRRELKVVPAEDEALERLSEPVGEELDSLGEGFDADLIRTAFRGLSERDQRVLWHTTVEGEAPRTLAPVLGMSANAVSARAMRAREALRAQYLDACARRSLPGADSEDCRWAISHLGAHVRGRLPKRQSARVEEHLKSCPHATLVAADLRAIHQEFPALIVPLVFLAGLSTPGFVSAAATAALSAGAGAAGGAGAAAAAASTGGSGAAGGVAGASASGGATAAATSSPPPGSAVGDAVGQLAGRSTAFVAAVALGVGLANAAPAPANPVAAVQQPAVTSAAPTQPVVPPSTPSPPTVPTSTAPTTPAPSPLVAPVPTASPRQAPSPSPQAAPVGTTPSPTSPATSPPTSPATSPPTSPPTVPPVVSPTPQPPTTEPTAPPVPRVSPATASVHVVQQRESTRFLLKVRGVEGRVSIVVSTPAGGELRLLNSAWACTTLAPSSLRCTGAHGQAMLLQSGVADPSPIQVIITDSTGATRTQTLSLG